MPKKKYVKRLVRARRPPLRIAQILAWADEHRERTGKWPNLNSGWIHGTADDKWMNVNACLREGLRGLPRGSSLARVLSEHRGHRNKKALPGLTVDQVLKWADAFRRRTGQWPRLDSGPIPEAPGEAWSAVQAALVNGARGFPGGSSLAQLLAAHRGVRNIGKLPSLRVKTILRWADAHFARTGRWPKHNSGPIAAVPGETWNGLDHALHRGSRGLNGGSSLARLLAARRGVRNQQNLPRLTQQQILKWADAHYRRTGAWPNADSGSIDGAPAETWLAMESALRNGHRGLRRGSSLARLLAARRGVRNPRDCPLTIRQILRWADAHYRRARRYPSHLSGPVVDAPRETWSAIHSALRQGGRGLPPIGSLARLLQPHRRSFRGRRKLTCKEILKWAKAHRNRTGRWPSAGSGPIPEAPGETWRLTMVHLGRGGDWEGTGAGRSPVTR